MSKDIYEDDYEMAELDRLCEFCDERKLDVKYCIDPYLEELFGEEEWVDICDDCYDGRANDV